MHDLIRPDASFTPRELFARMQGAWFEPRQGSMWQENTGATPTTSGGQTIGLLLGLDQQQQLSSELTTNGTFDADVNGWTGINGTLVWDTGRAKITASNTAPICISSGITTVVGAWYVLTTTLARGTGTAITGYVAATNNSNGSAAYADGSATPVIAGTARLVFRATATTTYVYARYDGASAGQTYFFDDFSLKQIFGNHASQATAANRPVLGRRYNIFQHSEEFSNSYWSKINSSVLPNVTAAPNGTLTADKLIEDSANAIHWIERSINNEKGESTFSIYLKAAERTKARIYLSYGYGYSCIVDLTNGTVVSNSGFSITSELIEIGWYKWSFSFSIASTQILFYYVQTALSDNSFIYTGDGTSGIYIWGADLRLSADVGKDPVYQRITTATDYDAGRFPAIRHADSTDVLAAAMPAINVRRNLLTYSEQFDNAAWTTVLDQTVGASYLIDKNIYAQTLIANSAAYSHRKQAFTAVVGNIYTASIHIKKTGSKSYNALFQANIGLSKYCAVLINTYTGVCTVVTGGIYNAPSVTPITVDKNDCWRVSLTFAPLASGIEIQIYSSVNASGGSLTGPSAGDNAFGGVQLELGSVATDYQKVTDWTSEAYSSSGSTYFSTPSGMSCMHNQSIGTSYNLPALQTDIYGVVITPARLAPPLEQRLALYMNRLAGLSDADFFWQEDYGPDVVTNGGFDTDSAWIKGMGWSISGGVASVIQNSFAQNLTQECLTAGKVYIITFTITQAATVSHGIRITLDGGTTFSAYYKTPGTYSFTAAATISLLIFQSLYADISVDNISVREFLDGQVGQLLADDNDTILLRA